MVVSGSSSNPSGDTAASAGAAEGGAAQARELLAGLLGRMMIPAEIEVHEDDDRITLAVDCENEDDTQRLIGRRGQLIDALQHLVGKMLATARDERGKPLVVDAGGYRARHVERLEELAARMADKCKETGADVDLNPMTAHDRRIIHMALAEVAGVSTRSEGEGDLRHVVVIPADE
jgi:spoIIIJ-associated protein